MQTYRYVMVNIGKFITCLTLSGVIASLVTLFDCEGKVGQKPLRNEVESQIGWGFSALGVDLR